MILDVCLVFCLSKPRKKKIVQKEKNYEFDYVQDE